MQFHQDVHLGQFGNDTRVEQQALGPFNIHQDQTVGAAAETVGERGYITQTMDDNPGLDTVDLGHPLGRLPAGLVRLEGDDSRPGHAQSQAHGVIPLPGPDVDRVVKIYRAELFDGGVQFLFVGAKNLGVELAAHTAPRYFIPQNGPERTRYLVSRCIRRQTKKLGCR